MVNVVKQVVKNLVLKNRLQLTEELSSFDGDNIARTHMLEEVSDFVV